MTSETLEAELRKDAEELIREDLALEALFRQQGMEVTDAEIDEELVEIAKATNSTPEEARKKWEEMGLMAVIREGVMHRMAVGWLMDNVTVIEVEPSDEDSESDDSAASKGTKKAAKKSKKADKTEKSEVEAEVSAEAESTEE